MTVVPYLALAAEDGMGRAVLSAAAWYSGLSMVTSVVRRGMVFS